MLCLMLAFLVDIARSELHGKTIPPFHYPSPNNYINTFVKHLSYGEKRKLEISRLVIEKKKLWIFDEPYLGLDDIAINIFNETLKNHTETEGMVILSSHYHLEMGGLDTIYLENYANN